MFKAVIEVPGAGRLKSSTGIDRLAGPGFWARLAIPSLRLGHDHHGEDRLVTGAVGCRFRTLSSFQQPGIGLPVAEVQTVLALRQN